MPTVLCLPHLPSTFLDPSLNLPRSFIDPSSTLPRTFQDADEFLTAEEMKRLNDLKGRDFSEAANYLFNEREGAVLLQASLRGLNVLDCVLKLSFLEGRTVSVMPIEEFLRTHVTSGDENDAHTRHVVPHIYNYS